jgi:hypothetical protein
VTKHPFRLAIEAGTPEAIGNVMAPDVTIFTPMLSKRVTGRDQVLNVVKNAARIAGPIQYQYEVSDGRQTFLIWKGQVGGFPLEAATILVDGEDGLIREMRVLMRAWPVVTLFRDAMYAALSETIPEDYWELGPRSVPTGADRKFTPIALKPIDKAAGMVLHSPMLAKAVSGREPVEEAVKIAHEVQSRSSYTSIVATPELIIELFDCDADGYPMEGMWIQKLNPQGQIYDLTVLLRPYPAVTVLRNKAKALADARGVLVDYWDLPQDNVAFP